MYFNVYCVDGPHAGQIRCIDKHSFVMHKITPRGPIECGPEYAVKWEETHHQVHIFAQDDCVGYEELVAFPAWRFVTWSVDDLDWARGMCKPSLGHWMRRRTVNLASVEQSRSARSFRYSDLCEALRLLPPDEKYRLWLPRPPRGYVWPAEYDRFAGYPGVDTPPPGIDPPPFRLKFGRL